MLQRPPVGPGWVGAGARGAQSDEGPGRRAQGLCDLHLGCRECSEVAPVGRTGVGLD